MQKPFCRLSEKPKTSSPSNTLHKALVDLYMSLKQRCEPDEHPAVISAHEEDNLLALDPMLLVEYIKSSIDILTSTQVEKALQMAEQRREETNESSMQKDNSQNLEELTQNLEAEVRLHIRMEQQQRLKIESMESLIEENDRNAQKNDDHRKKLETDNKELHEVCMKKQAENEQLKKQLSEKIATIEQLKKSLALSNSRPAPAKQTQYIMKKTSGGIPTVSAQGLLGKEKENNGPITTIRTASIDLHEDHNEKLEMKPQLQEAYNKLIKEIKVKNDMNGITKKRTDSFHIAPGPEKKMVNATINPYITQAWEQNSEQQSINASKQVDEIFKKITDANAVSKSMKNISKGQVSKITNKSAISEERTHMRSSSHSIFQ